MHIMMYYCAYRNKKTDFMAVVYLHKEDERAELRKLRTENWKSNLVLVVIIKMEKAADGAAHAQSDFLYGNKYASMTCFVVWKSEKQRERKISDQWFLTIEILSDYGN